MSNSRYQSFEWDKGEKREGKFSNAQPSEGIDVQKKQRKCHHYLLSSTSMIIGPCFAK